MNSPCKKRPYKAGEKDAQTIAGEAQYGECLRAEMHPQLNRFDDPRTPSKRTKKLVFASPAFNRSVNRNGFHDSMSREYYSHMPISLHSQKILSTQKSAHRDIPKFPYKVLDAPDLQDDFYLNLVDWGESNVLSVGLSSCVYLWAANSSKVTKLCDLAGQDDKVTSVTWNKEGKRLAVGMLALSYPRYKQGDCQDL
jgi:cell division cycle 20-like protein 1 (cofactor of APC complex)